MALKFNPLTGKFDKVNSLGDALNIDPRTNGKSIVLSDGDRLEDLSGNSFIDLKKSNIVGRSSFSDVLNVEKTLGFVSINTNMQLGNARLNVNGPIATPNHLLTQGGSNTYFYGQSGTVPHFGTPDNNGSFTMIRGVYKDVISTNEGISFKKHSSVSEGYTFEFLTRGENGKFKIGSFASSVASGIPISNTQIDLVSNYYNGIEENNIAKTEIKNVVLNSDGEMLVDFSLKATSVFKLKDTGVVNAPNLPTSATGLVSGDIWIDGTNLKIVI